MSDKDAGVYVGRLSPMHLGHEAQIKGLLEEFPERHLVLIGSCNQPSSFRHMFSYEDRCDFIQAVFPSLRLAPLPDFESDGCWFRALDQILELAGYDPDQAVFFGGCQEDANYFHLNGRKTRIRNRFSGETPKVSATEVRDALIERRSIDGLVNPQLIPLISERFALRWAALRKK